MKKYNYIVSVVMLLLSGYIFYESSGYTIGSSAQKNPAVWPCILAGALALLSVALIIETALKKEPGEEKKVWGDRIFEKCGIGRDERGDGGKTLEIRGKRRLSARDGGANYQQS